MVAIVSDAPGFDVAYFALQQILNLPTLPLVAIDFTVDAGIAAGAIDMVGVIAQKDTFKSFVAGSPQSLAVITRFPVMECNAQRLKLN